MRKIINFFRHFFIPHEDNNFRPKTLHPDFLSFFLVLAFFLSIILKYTSLSNVLDFATDITIEKLYQLTNQQRGKYSLSSLKYNEKLSQAAYQKAQDMFAKNYWAHYGPDGTTPWEFILSSGYRYEYAGENLAKNFLFSNDVVSAWMNSPTHRENILRKEYTDIGFAVVNGVLNGEETTLVVQMFGKPLSPVLVKEVSAQEKSQKTIEKKQLLENENKLMKKNNLVLAKNTSDKKIKLAFTFFSFNFAFMFFLILVLILDFYFASKLGIIRLSGKNFFHLIFILFLLLGLLLVRQGAIL